jgi:hypothetical protein
MAPRGRRPLLRRLRRAPGAAPRSACAFAVVGVAALLSCAVARADVVTPPPTTTVDAPPPDRYTPPPAKQPAPKKSAPVTHVTPQAPVRSYTPPATPAPTRVATPKPVRRPKAVQRQRKKPQRAKPVPISLAPLAHILAASRLPLPAAQDDERPYLWLAGLAFAVLAVAGLSLQVLSLRYFRPELR